MVIIDPTTQKFFEGLELPLDNEFAMELLARIATIVEENHIPRGIAFDASHCGKYPKNHTIPLEFKESLVSVSENFPHILQEFLGSEPTVYQLLHWDFPRN